jgi:hypothetical protein
MVALEVGMRVSIRRGSGLKRTGIARDSRGAVLVEFMVALMPLLLSFFVFFQVAVMVTAKMFVRHATIAAARAGIVIKGGGATNPMKEGKEQGTDLDIQNAFQAGLGMWGQNGNKMLIGTVSVIDPGGPTGDVVATSTVLLKCNVPLGRRFVCTIGGYLPMVDRATLPKQGAEYK